MEILIISKSRGAAGGLRLNSLGLLLALAVTLGGIAGAAYWGYARGGDEMLEVMLENPERSAQVWQREILEQRRFLADLRRDLAADLSALSGSMGEMQGSLTRLDAAAEHVMAVSGLDAAEFDFDSPPPMGGPRPAASEPPDWSELLGNLSALSSEISIRQSRLDMIEALLRDRRTMDDMRPGGVPLTDGWISSAYGYRTHPVSGRREFHSGIDLAGTPGVEVRSIAPGVVTWSGKRWAYGNLVEINHGKGYVTRYAHNRVNLVSIGEKVDKNQPIALLGATGRATGPHVHFEVVHNDKTINPAKFIRRHAEN
ncbi:MAG: M23 family metallopeptidase [Gammaproteobacteria bacterium]